jgi:FkbM family methyltransferase
VLTEFERAQLTASCRDTDAIPKVDNAGAVLSTPEGSVQVMHNGVLVREGCYYGDWMTEIIRNLRGHHEPQEEVVFHEIVELLAADTPRPTMLELGAFWSYYSLWLLQRVPDARALLVEPDPNNLQVGKANLALNGRRAEILQAAVGSQPLPPRPFVCDSDSQSRLVPTESLSSLMTHFGASRLDLLLLDVQGAELDFLEGGRSVLADHVRFVMVSTHHHTISGDPATHQRCLQLLTGLGAHILAEHTVAESFSGDGFIAASFDRRDAQLQVSISYARANESLYGDPVVELAQAHANGQVLGERLDAALAELAAEHAALERAEAAYTTALATTARLEAELMAIRATATWRMHQGLLRSRAGRGVLRGLSRAARMLNITRRTNADTVLPTIPTSH